MKNFLKIIFTNIGILIALLIFLNIATISVYKLRGLIKKDVSDLRADLPNYNGLKWAKNHFKELSNLETNYNSFIGWRRNEFVGKTININSEGIRKTIQNEKITDTSKVAIFLGSSLIWGTGVNDSTTIPSYFSKYSSGKFYTYNFGESEYSPYQSLLMLKIKLKQGYNPDLVISYDGPNLMFSLIEGNDIYSHSRENQIKNILTNYIKYDNTKIFSFYDFFIKKPEIFIMSFYNKYFNKKINKFYKDPNKIKNVATFLCDVWLETYNLSKENNSKFLAVLAQNYSIGNPNLSHLNIDNSNNIYPLLYNEIKKILYSDDKYTNLSQNILFLEDEIFSNDEYFYIDSSHISPNGNSLIAKNIYEKVKKIF
jgi:lysophospholipase L1-like esterase